MFKRAIHAVGDIFHDIIDTWKTTKQMYFPKKPLAPPAAQAKLADIVESNMQHFRNNPRQLAWAMMQYRILGHAADTLRMKTPQFKIVCSESDIELVNAAYAMSSNETLFNIWDQYLALDSQHPLAQKPNKTLDDWEQLSSDERGWKSASSILTMHQWGTEARYEWNKDGYIQLAIKGVDVAPFFGYMRVEHEVPSQLRDTILSVCSRVASYVEHRNVYLGSNKIEKEFLSERSLIDQFVDNGSLREKLLHVLHTTLYREELRWQAREWSDEQWEEAAKKPTYTLHGHEFNIGDFDVDHFCLGSVMMRRVMSNQKPDPTNPWKDWGADGTRDDMYKWFMWTEDEKDPRYNDMLQQSRALPFSNRTRAQEKQNQLLNIMLRDRPSKKKYGELYKKASAGDSDARQRMDELAGVPKKGWDAFRFEVNGGFKPLGQTNYSNTNNPSPRWCIEEEANMMDMPNNAHPSYVERAKQIAQEVISDPIKSSQKRYQTSVALAEQFLKKWR